MLDKILNELIPKQAKEIKKAVRDGIPIMIVDNTGSGCEAREMLRCELKANNAILIPDTVSEFREYNTAYLRIELNIEGGEGMSDLLYSLLGVAGVFLIAIPFVIYGTKGAVQDLYLTIMPREESRKKLIEETLKEYRIIKILFVSCILGAVLLTFVGIKIFSL